MSNVPQETLMTQFCADDPKRVRLCSSFVDANDLLTDVRVNGAGELLYGWPVHDSNDSVYQPAVETMIAIQLATRETLQKHSSEEGFDKFALNTVMGHSKNHGG